MQLTYEELKQLNEGRCIEPQEDLRAAAKRSKLRDDLEAAVKKFINSGGEIKEVESTIKPRSEHVSDLFDDEYCGSAKIALVLHWLNVKGHNNGRRTRLSALSGVPLHRIYNMAYMDCSTRITNREYLNMRKVMRRVEAMENDQGSTV